MSALNAGNEEQGWPTVALTEVARIDRKTVAADDIEAGSLYVGLEHVTSDGTFDGVSPVEPGDLKSTKFEFTRDHILYGKLRPYLAKIAAPSFAGICSTDIIPLLPGTDIDRQYLLHFLRTPQMVSHASRSAVGINLPRLSPKVLESFQIPLPPIEEQRRIAAILEAADELRAKRRQALAKLDALTQALFIDLFGHPVTNPRGWPVNVLSDLGDLDRGVSKHRPRNDPTLLGGRWPLIQTGDVAGSGGYITNHSSTYSDLGLAQSKLWPAGTLCITIAANIAKTGILTFDACFPDSVVGFSAKDEGGAEYVRFVLGFLQPILEKQAPESAQKNINLKVLRELKVPVPPVELRASFADQVQRLNEAQQDARLHHSGLDTLFSSLQQRAFRGEL